MSRLLWNKYISTVFNLERKTYCAAWMEDPTKLNAALAFFPSVVIAARHTTIIRDSITAYSTAVGPSSRFKKLTMRLAAH